MEHTVLFHVQTFYRNFLYKEWNFLHDSLTLLQLDGFQTLRHLFLVMNTHAISINTVSFVLKGKFSSLYKAAWIAIKPMKTMPLKHFNPICPLCLGGANPLPPTPLRIFSYSVNLKLEAFCQITFSKFLFLWSSFSFSKLFLSWFTLPENLLLKYFKHLFVF